MGDKSPQKQIKIGNLTVKLNPNNQQKNRRDLNYDRNYYHKNNDRYNERGNDRYNERERRRDKETDRDRERNKRQYDNKNYNNDRERDREKGYKKNESNDSGRYINKKNEYDRKEKYKNYNNKSESNSRSGSRHRHSYNRNNRSRSRSRSHSYHKNYINDLSNKNNQIDNSNKNNNPNNLNANNSLNSNNNSNINNNNNNAPFNNNLPNQPNNNMGFINPMSQNFINNYNEFLKRFYSMNNKAGNNATNNFIVPIGIPVNYFYNPNLNNMNQMNQMNKINNLNNMNNNNNTQTNNQNQNQNQKKTEKEEPSNTILITDLDTNITKETIEDIFREKCLKLQISMPIDIRLVEALNIAYIIFPSVTSCVIVYNSLINQKILINGKYFPAQFSPNLTSKYANNRDTLTYVTQISSNTSLTTSMETTIHEDWYCVYCDSKNFSRRTVCFKCQKPKSINCRVVPVIKQKKIILGANGEILPNNSIIIQGKQIQYSNEGEVFIFLLI